MLGATDTARSPEVARVGMVTVIEVAFQELQSIGLDSIGYIHHPQLLTFPTNRRICFSLKANSNLLKTMQSCTVRTQQDFCDDVHSQPFGEMTACTVRQLSVRDEN